jgi:hypothetical protein
MLVYVRPSNEALQRARVPGAQDQHGCPSHPSDAAHSASTEDHQAPFPPLLREQGTNAGAMSFPLREQVIRNQRGEY